MGQTAGLHHFAVYSQMPCNASNSKRFYNVFLPSRKVFLNFFCFFGNCMRLSQTELQRQIFTGMPVTQKSRRLASTCREMRNPCERRFPRPALFSL